MKRPTKSFALALGSGGARGLAHIAVIEALDDMGAKPVAIAGTSLPSSPRIRAMIPSTWLANP